MPKDKEEFDKDQFLANLKKANAEELKLRVLKSAQQLIKSAGLSKSRLKEVDIDISDYLK